MERQAIAEQEVLVNPLNDSFKVRALILSLCLSIFITTATGLSLQRSWNSWAEDLLYQQPRALKGNVVVIGIDAQALQQLGPWPWDRSIFAEVIQKLNGDPLSRPAAIGLDVTYSGETEPSSDAALAKAIADAGNVAISCNAQFENTLLWSEDETAYMDDFYVSSLVLPLEKIARSALVGHVNAMYDTDGVLRHHLWTVDDGEGGEIPSLPYQLYALYCDYRGLETDFSPPRDERGFWYVNFSGLPGAFYEYSVADIINDDFDPVALEGAAVLIGPYDMGLADDFVTPVDHAARMFGVEYMANVLNAMIEGDSRKELPQNPQLAALALISFLCAYLCFTKKLILSSVICAFAAAGSVVLCTFFYESGYVLHPLWIPPAIFLCVAFGIIHHYYTAQKEKRYIRDTFRRYVDPGILHELLRENSDSLKLGGKTVDIAVLFVDLRGFTTMSESLEPHQVVEILNEYLTLTSACICQNGGTLDKFIGDCTMAFWGAPLPAKDAVFQACRAAMDMIEGEAALFKAMEEKYGRGIDFGVGIHYGPAVVGNIGALERMDYTAIGDTVNTAARLEASAPAHKIYISRMVADRLGDRGTTTSLGNQIKLKGKSDLFEILTLDSLKEGGTI